MPVARRVRGDFPWPARPRAQPSFQKPRMSPRRSTAASRPAGGFCGSRPPGCRGASCIRASGSSCIPTTGTPTASTAAASTSGGSPARPRRPTRAACRDEGLSLVRRSRASGSCSATPWPRARARLVGEAIWKQVRAVARLLEVLRQHGADPPPHAPVVRATPSSIGQEGKPESYYFPPQYNNCDNNFPYTFMGLEPGTTKDDVRTCLENWNKGDNGILDLVEGLPPEAGHRLADPAGRAARPRLAVHLRAAVGQRRVRHVPVAGRRARGAVGPAGQGHARGQAPGPRLHHRASSTGRRTSTPTSRRRNYLEPIVDEQRSGDGCDRPLDRLRPGRRPAALLAPRN